MQKLLNLLLVLLIMGFVSCSSSKPENDSDNIPDSDIDTQDPEIVDADSDSQDSDVIDDSDETPDADAPEKVECLDLRYNENTIKTPFPFKDANGKPTFCRPGCDTPTENDPQCVRNIWEWDNWEEYQDYLKAQEKDPNQEWERECYPWPCKLPDMKAMTKDDIEDFTSTCDRWLTTGGFTANDGVIWTHGMSDGVAGMSFAHSTRVVEYDPEKDEYSTLGHSYVLGFNENRYVVEIYDRNLDKFTDEKRFIVSILRQNGKYYYELIYDNPSHGSFLSRSPLVGKNWVLIHVRENQQSSVTAIKYASSKDWEWHELTGINNYAGEGNIVGDHLTFITNNRELYYCDLRKYPKHIDECFKLNRKDETGEEELGHSPRIDIENEYRVVYNVYRKPVFVEVDLHDLKNPKYKDYTIENSKETAYSKEIDMFLGNKVSYQEYFTLSDGTVDVIGCFYRFDKKKTYCPSDHTFTPYRNDDLMGYNVFWGKWHLWKRITRPTAIMRDWECYCEETGVCPMEPATEEELNRKPMPLKPVASKVTPEILVKVEQEKILPKFDRNEVYFCMITERELNRFGEVGCCPTAVQMNKYLESPDKSEPQLKEHLLKSKPLWKTEKSFADLVKKHEKIWEKLHGCDLTSKDFVCEYDEMTSTFDSDSVMFATVIDNGVARDGIFFRDRFYEANGDFAKVIRELRQKFGASLRGMPRIEVKENKNGGEK